MSAMIGRGQSRSYPREVPMYEHSPSFGNVPAAFSFLTFKLACWAVPLEQLFFFFFTGEPFVVLSTSYSSLHMRHDGLAMSPAPHVVMLGLLTPLPSGSAPGNHDKDEKRHRNRDQRPCTSTRSLSVQYVRDNSEGQV